MRKALGKYDLTLFQLEILLAVELHEGDTITDIMGRGLLDGNAFDSIVTKALQRLAEGISGKPGRDLIKKQISPHNANARILFLTDKGHALLSEVKTELNIK